MSVLDRFEQGVERLVEGSIGRLFRSPVQPAEIGRKLERAMVAGQVVSVDSTLVPNDFRVAMHPLDMVLFVDYVAALSRQMEQWLAEVATARDFTLIDRVRVQIAGDGSVPYFWKPLREHDEERTTDDAGGLTFCGFDPFVSLRLTVRGAAGTGRQGTMTNPGRIEVVEVRLEGRP